MRSILLLFLLITSQIWAQYDGNTTPTYPELVKAYEALAAEHNEIELYNMGESDYGLPIYLCVINGALDSTRTFEKARNNTTILINNAIHPGEPDGVNACLIWIHNWIDAGKKMKDLPVLAIIPAYNVGGMMNRSGTSRANQNGPEEYGFRGNAQNLDLNRDFIKMDSKNMFTFAKIYHALDPDVFLDTHVSNGADYQYTMTYIASVRERMSPSMGNLMHDELIPYLKEFSSQRKFDLIPYVNLKKDVPDSGIVVFNDLPRYAMGYAQLMNAISFTSETHMLKPFPERVQSTLVFIEGLIEWTSENKKLIEKARLEADNWERNLSQYQYGFTDTDAHDSILFNGFEFEYILSPITQKKRLKYHQDRPYSKHVPYYNEYEPTASISIPEKYIIGVQCDDVINRLKANNVQMRVLQHDSIATVRRYQVHNYQNGNNPYEGHFLHTKTFVVRDTVQITLKAGDVIVPTEQKNIRFIVSVLEPDTPDSYFNWNFFDNYVQQKEYFSPYVFEDRALLLLEEDPQLKADLEQMKEDDPEFAESSWDQLYFIYKRSPYFEPSYNVLPIYGGF